MIERIARRPEPEIMDLPEEAEAYARADFSDVNDAFVRRLLELAGPRETARAVDLGCGPADIPIRLLRIRPRWRVAAVDASPAMLDLARKAVAQAGLAHAVDFVLADAKSRALPDAAFDVVFSNSILHHIADVAPFWAQVRRIAAPRALLFLRDLARPAEATEAAAIVARYAGNESPLLREEFQRSLLAAYTPDEVRRQLADAGLDRLTVTMVTDRHLDVFGTLA
jgi:ubiquinone/menaquinone biosynthesis C-methylase UbiE